MPDQFSCMLRPKTIIRFKLSTPQSSKRKFLKKDFLTHYFLKIQKNKLKLKILLLINVYKKDKSVKLTAKTRNITLDI